jgi:preprotein translocase subunit SecE
MQAYMPIWMSMKDIVQFLSEVRIELNKVIWPKYDDWVGSTIIVLVLTAIFALYLGLIDFGLSKLASYIFKVYGS